MSFIEEVDRLSRSKCPVIGVETYEEERVIDSLSVYAKSMKRKLIVWDVSNGIVEFPKKPPVKAEDKVAQDPNAALEYCLNYGEPSVFLFKDINFCIKDHQIMRTIRNINYKFKVENKLLVFCCPQLEVPTELAKSINMLGLQLPSVGELANSFDNAIKTIEKSAKSDAETKKYFNKYVKPQLHLRDEMAYAALGLTTEEFENIIAQCIITGDFGLDAILREKKQTIQKSGVLEFYEALEDLSDIGGLNVLKEEILKYRGRFTKDAVKFGLEPPKGVLLVGPPGTGKSLSVKVIAKVLGLPLLRIDMSRIASKWYGETTGRLRLALKIAEAMSPCILWFDEVEKMFSTGEGEGHEETQRANSVWLTHFEECRAPIFNVATCNHTTVKPELMQRFERAFFLDLPDMSARKEIFAIHIAKTGRDPGKFNLDELALATEGFVGREIRVVVKEGLATAFYAEPRRDLLTEDMVAEALRMTPTSQQKEREITMLREWASTNAINASCRVNKRSVEKNDKQNFVSMR